MPKKIQNTTKAHIISVPLPNHGATYTVISHQFVIDYAYQALANAGFGIVDEEYRCTADGQIAQGVYKLQFNSDPELSMMFAWTNSYNKQVKFKCVVGAYINDTGSVMISGDMGSWVRKHMGTADTETKATIDDYVTNAYMYYNQLVADKTSMKGVMLNTRKQAQLLGVLFAEYGILTTEQASFIRDQMKRPAFTFESNDSLWAFYNYVTLALQQSHPRTWMEDQRILHHFISSIYNFHQCSAPAQIEEPINSVNEVIETEVDPNQINLLDAIAEAEAMADLETLQEIKTEESEPSSITLDEVIQYTDPQGNTFEAPVVETFTEQLEKKMVEQAKEDTEVLESMLWGITPSLEPTPEDHVVFEAEQFQQEENPFAEEDNFELIDDVVEDTPVEITPNRPFSLLTEEEEEEQESFNWDLDDDDESSDDGPDFF